MVLINSRLGRTDRIVNMVVGAGVAAYALLGEWDNPWVRLVVLAIGLVYLGGGFCGL